MTDLTTSLRLDLRNSQFNRGLLQSGQQVQRFANGSTRELRGLNQQFRQLTGGVMGSFRNQLLAIGASWSGLRIAKDSALLDKNLTRMSQTAGVARTETKALRQELFALQQQYGVAVDSSRTANDTLLASGLSWAEALKATQAIAPASAVTGAKSDALAGGLAVGSEIFNFDLAQAGVATDILDKMTVAGRAGNAELENLASIFARVGGNAKKANLDFDQTLGFIEQLSFIERKPERLATLADSTLRIFTNNIYQQKVHDSLGVDFYNKKGERRDSFSVIGDISTIYQKQKTDQQRDALIAAAFGKTDLDTQRGIQQLLSGDNVAGMRAITGKSRGAAGAIAADVKDALDNAIDQTGRLKGALGQAADAFVMPINAAISKIIKHTLDSKKEGGLGLDGKDLLLGGAATLVGGAALYKYGGGVARKLFGGAGNLAGGVAAGAALEEMAGVTPVYVVNMPGSLGGMPAAALPTTPTVLPSAATSVFSRARTAAALLGGSNLSALPMYGSAALGWAGVGVAGAGAAGYGVGSLVNRGFQYSDDNFDTSIQSALADTLGKSLAKIAAALGNDNAKAALDADARAQATLKIEVDDRRVNVRKIDARNIAVDMAGVSMMMP